MILLILNILHDLLILESHPDSQGMSYLGSRRILVSAVELGGLFNTKPELFSLKTQKDAVWGLGFGVYLTLRVQVPNNHILTQKPILESLLPKSQVPKYWVLGPVGLHHLGILVSFGV